MKQTKLITEKILKDGKKYRKILGWENIECHMNLQEEYHEGYPSYYSFSSFDGFDVYVSEENRYSVYKNSVMKEEKFQNMVMNMKKAGEILSKINAKVKWNGTEIVKI